MMQEHQFKFGNQLIQILCLKGMGFHLYNSHISIHIMLCIIMHSPSTTCSPVDGLDKELGSLFLFLLLLLCSDFLANKI